MNYALPTLVLFLSINGELQARKWTDLTGRFSLEAELVDSSDGVVTLKREDGTTTRLPLNKLSEADRQFIRDLEVLEKPSTNTVLSPEDEMRQSLKISAVPVESELVKQVVSSELYKVSISIATPNGEQVYDKDRLYCRANGKLEHFDDANIGGPKPMLQGAIRKDFRLRTHDDAKLLQQVLHELYPINTKFAKPDAIFIKKDENRWSFTRKSFVKKYIGFVFATDPDGVITAAELSFQITK